MTDFGKAVPSGTDRLPIAPGSTGAHAMMSPLADAMSGNARNLAAVVAELRYGGAAYDLDFASLMRRMAETAGAMRKIAAELQDQGLVDPAEGGGPADEETGTAWAASLAGLEEASKTFKWAAESWF
ncbi:hypothetical protein ACQEVF_46975 [Nonomuraea polychroma]|uniref:hypothetical protein n=1 Tax=Nonomuraea polychroma TaxID=46176 RepID=UPI003D92F463